MKLDLILLLSTLGFSPVKAGLQSRLKEQSREDQQPAGTNAQCGEQGIHKEEMSGPGTLQTCPSMHDFNPPSVCSAELVHPIGELAKGLNDGNHLSQVLQHLGTGCLIEGRLTDALGELENALTVAMATEHGAPGQTANVLHVLGNVHLEMGNISKALQLYNEARHLGSVLPQLSIDMGEAYSRRGLLDMASSHLQHALGKLEQDSIEAARAYSLDGFIRYSRGNANASFERFQEALRIQAKSLHPGHPDLVLTTMRMARAQRDLAGLEVALQTTEALEKTLLDLPLKDLELSRVLTQKADLLRELQRLPDAEQAMKKVSALQASIFRKKAMPEVASALNIYGGIFQDQGKFVEAEIQYRQALDMNLASVGQWHSETAAIHNSLGTLFQDVGNLTAAREHFHACLEIQLKTLGEGNPEVASTYNNIATTLFQQGQPTEAAKLLKHALSLLDAAQVPKQSPDRMLFAENLEAVMADAS